MQHGFSSKMSICNMVSQATLVTTIFVPKGQVATLFLQLVQRGHISCKLHLKSNILFIVNSIRQLQNIVYNN